MIGRQMVLTALCAIALGSGFAQEPELLEPDDVSKVMQQMFDQHIDQKTISAKLIKHSFQIYIDHFDPERTYLLQSEIDPYVNMDAATVEKVLNDYKKNQFVTYSDLNQVIQKSILRARKFREKIEVSPDALFKESLTYTSDGGEEWSDPDLKKPFPKDDTQLQQRQKQQVMKFIAAERVRFGEQVMANPKRTLDIYDRNLDNFENRYLYLTNAGQKLSAAEEQNLFVMHILKSLANSLDSHTSFLAPSEAYDMRVRLEKAVQGIGVVLQKNSKGEVFISKMVDGGPAARDGHLKINDVIVAIDNKPVANLTLDGILNLVRGGPDTKIQIEVKRSDLTTPIKVELKREAIAVNDDRADFKVIPYKDGIIGVIKLQSFYQGDNGVNSEADVRQAIQKLDDKGNLRGLILDLRENSGGFLTQAVKVAGLFISNGVVVISKYSNGNEKFYRDMDGKTMYNGPLIILTSKATASAAEIVAEALQDYGVALVVGDEHTYGKGTIQSQTVTENQGTSYFKVTVGKYYTVSGKTPQMQGVKADVVVPGQFSKENIGEEFLDYPLEKDVISSAYHDKLSDIDPTLKNWYLRYYMPTLQQTRADWRGMVSQLKTNSAKRIAENPSYQAFLNNKLNNPKTIEDLQLNEAVNVVKDMIDLHDRQLSKQIVEEKVKKN